MVRACTWCWVAMVVSACAADGGSSDTDPPVVDEALAPTEGSWAASSFDVVDDGCDLGPRGPDSTPSFSLDITGDDSFSIVLDDPHLPGFIGADPVFSCTLSESSFDCGDLAFDVEVDTSTVTWTLSLSGTFEDASSCTADYARGAVCEGDTCDSFAASVPVPCESTYVLVAAASGE